MKPACHDFRERLAQALAQHSSGPLADERGPLAWNAHAFACADCRRLLESEEALEELLASLPQPVLPIALARRVLKRLMDAEPVLAAATDLDDMLDLVVEPEPPAGLGERVLAGLERERELDRLLDAVPLPSAPSGLAERVLLACEERRLDELLEALPEPLAPTGLAERVLAGLAVRAAPSEQLVARASSPILRPRFGLRRVAASAAAVLAVAFIGYRLLVGGFDADERERAPLNVAEDQTDKVEAPLDPSNRIVDAGGGQPAVGSELDDERVQVASSDAPGEELLEMLDVLEDWELLMGDDVDLLLGSLEEGDAELLLLATVEEES